MKIQFACLLLVLLSAAVVSWTLDFYQMHVRRRMSADQCNEKMKDINEETGSCKPINTFILSTKNTVKSVCVKSGENKSKVKFKIVVCDNPRGKYPKCDYSGQESEKYITIECNNNVPFHFVGSSQNN